MDTLTNNRKRTRVVSFNSIDEELMFKPFQPTLFVHAKKQSFLEDFLHKVIYDMVDIDDRLDDLLSDAGSRKKQKPTCPVIEEPDVCHMNMILQSFLQSPVSRNPDQFLAMINVMETEKKQNVVVVEKEENVVPSLTKAENVHEDCKDRLIPLLQV